MSGGRVGCCYRAGLGVPVRPLQGSEEGHGEKDQSRQGASCSHKVGREGLGGAQQSAESAGGEVLVD